MPSAPKSAAHAGSPKEGPSFEVALKDLETIVDAMESEELPLETLLQRYEEGARLTQLCQAHLAAAEQRILLLEKRLTGDFHLKPGEPGQTES